MVFLKGDKYIMFLVKAYWARCLKYSIIISKVTLHHPAGHLGCTSSHQQPLLCWNEIKSLWQHCRNRVDMLSSVSFFSIVLLQKKATSKLYLCQVEKHWASHKKVSCRSPVCATQTATNSKLIVSCRLKVWAVSGKRNVKWFGGVARTLYHCFCILQTS